VPVPEEATADGTADRAGAEDHITDGRVRGYRFGTSSFGIPSAPTRSGLTFSGTWTLAKWPSLRQFLPALPRGYTDRYTQRYTEGPNVRASPPCLPAAPSLSSRRWDLPHNDLNSCPCPHPGPLQ
jgi:hypothetical protein